MSTDAAKALRAVEDALASYEKGTPAEREAMHDLADALRAMREKIAAGRVTPAVFGEISTGGGSGGSSFLTPPAARLSGNTGNTARRAAACCFGLPLRMPTGIMPRPRSSS